MVSTGLLTVISADFRTLLSYVHSSLRQTFSFIKSAFFSNLRSTSSLFNECIQYTVVETGNLLLSLGSTDEEVEKMERHNVHVCLD